MRSLFLHKNTVVSNANPGNHPYSPPVSCIIDVDLGDHDTELNTHGANKHWTMAID
jgi:hypothetical protein